MRDRSISDEERSTMSGVQSIERAFSVLRVLAVGPAGVTDIAERADLPKSTVSRLLTALEQEGAVAQEESGGQYVIGDQMRVFGDAAAPDASLAAVVRPVAESLSSETGGSAGFTVLRGDEVYWVVNVDQDEMVQVTDMTGHHFPLHAVPTGIALLASMDDADVDAYLGRAVTNAGEPIDPAATRALVERTARHGVMVCEEELDPGINAFAAAFRGPTGSYDAALYVQGPAFRFPGSNGDVVAKLVAEAADRLSDRFAIY